MRYKKPLETMMKQSDEYWVSVKRFYYGESMKGTFRQGDLVIVASTKFEDLGPGDVVVFFRQRPNSRCEIVHRVVRRVPGGLVTRGDAVACEDRVVVTERNLLGRVYHKERNGRVSRVHGGWIGLCRGRGFHLYWGVRRWGVRTIQPLYDMLKQSGIINRIWKPEITRVCLNTQDGHLIQFVHNKCVIARFWPEEDRFECRKPWDLVIGEVEDRRRVKNAGSSIRQRN